ncbi:hypothetical protein Poli38472_012538 [Pythium oligandrum]|uniref:EF-hand domain-containing protein n=1 Tax=Pythium oligandrum TaxID=41045 RepID=A0A8K1CFR3_PYTOL|nr:hypothetical protein Poli38472_012538 [Pythium oligandrum]|eukprot:TMW61347.1 hypothetical protein Poli38472_012538 [Pythium oligandrum]
MLARQVLRSASRVGAKTSTQQPLRRFSRSYEPLVRRSERIPLSTARGVRESEAVPILQAITIDRFGRQHRFEYQYRQHQNDNRENAKLLAKWTTALLATGACAVSALSDDSHARAAGSSGEKSSDEEDILEQLQKKVRAFIDENLSELQKLVPGGMGDIQKQTDDFLGSGKGGQISWGFMMGICSGFALKKVSKVGAVALGSIFILFQCASYSGYIDVNHKKLERDVLNVLDINKDGEFNAKDIDEVYKRVMKVLEYSLPAGSGFAVGFLVGFRSG